MEIPIHPQPETNNAKINLATEVAFSALVDRAKIDGLNPKPVLGLVYLPSEAVTQQFKEACRAVLADLGVPWQEEG